MRELLQGAKTRKTGTADSVQQPAATTTAAAGMPPEPHERAAVIVARPRPLGSFSRADRMALYKVIRRRRTARTLRGDWSERDAPLRQAEGTSLSHAVTDRERNAASQPARAVHGRPRIETRVKESLEGNAPPIRLAGPGMCYRAGLRSPRARRTHLTDADCPPRLTGLRSPCPALRGAADDGDAASVRGDLAET